MEEKLRMEQKIKITSAKEIYQVMQKILLRKGKNKGREHLWTISLNTANKIIAIELVSIGTLDEILIKPVEIFSFPFKKRASQIILIHNHPSDNITPSNYDISETIKLLQIGQLFDMPIIDHLIISTCSYYSFKETGLLDNLKQNTKHMPSFMLEKMIKNLSGILSNNIKNYMNDD